MRHTLRRTLLVLAATATLLGSGTALAAPVNHGLLPGPTPTMSWTRAEPAFATYFADCGPIVLDASGLAETPAYRRWITRLKRAGWHGLSADGIEAIYPPGC